MKSGSHFEQAGNAATQSETPSSRVCDSAQDFQKSGFSRTIATDNADNLALLDFEANVPQCPELLGRTGTGTSHRSKPLHRLTNGAFEGVPQAVASGRLMPEVVPFRKV